MLGKIKLYVHTIRYMKPEQILWRIGRKLGITCALKGAPPAKGNGRRIALSIPELDFDSVFLSRFSVDELMQDRVTFLHEENSIDWNGIWYADTKSHLWNFNLHYFEYIHPLTNRYLETGDKRALDKTVQMIRGWICRNPRESGGDGWSAYTISLRLTNWMAYIAAVGDKVDPSFRKELEESMFEQYVYLSEHLEKHILGNHYYENLKTLVLCSLFFGNTQSLPIYLEAFRKECREEILPDGMHFELSPMYQKIVLEGLLRVAVALREAEKPDAQLEQMAGDMLSAAWSLEWDLSRTPLFNDSGDNVAKSLAGLMACAGRYLDIAPVYHSAFPRSGYYIFTDGPWKLIIDAGQPGPSYIPGHSHCDSMSFELFRDGAPFLVNCGTYAYQCCERSWFRSTQAHNTVQVYGVEQSEIWSTFRLARRSATAVLEVLENGIRMEMTDYRGNRIRREILLKSDSLYIRDQARGMTLQNYLHSIPEIAIDSSGDLTRRSTKYAPEFGLLQNIHQITVTGRDGIELTVSLA